MDKSLFRKSSLDRIVSPEQVDQNLKIISSKGWLLFTACFILVILFIIWGIFGTINTKVFGQGIIITKGGLNVVQSQFTGEVRKVYFNLGDHVKKGEIVAKIALRDREERVTRLKDKLATSKVKLDKLLFNFSEEKKAIENKYKLLKIKQMADLESKVKNFNLKKWEVDKYKKLVKEGAISRARFSDTMVQVNNLESSIEQLKKSMPLISIDKQIKLAQEKMEIIQYKKDFLLLKGRVKAFIQQLDKDSIIRSQYTGLTVSNFFKKGDFINAGDKICEVQPDNAEIVAVVLFPVLEGKKIKSGMKVHISPSTVNKNQYGTIQGIVGNITAYPVGKESMKNFFMNNSVVDKFSSISAPIGAEVKLLHDKSTPSGYKWTSGKGPDITITNGTFVEGNIIVKQEPPVALLIPFLKKITGT